MDRLLKRIRLSEINRKGIVMERGQVVARKNSCGQARYEVGAVTGTEVRSDGWRYLEVQWVCSDKPLPITDRTEWVRHDDLLMLNPLEEMRRYQDVLTLSSALLSENYERALRKGHEIN